MILPTKKQRIGSQGGREAGSERGLARLAACPKTHVSVWARVQDRYWNIGGRLGASGEVDNKGKTSSELTYGALC